MGLFKITLNLEHANKRDFAELIKAGEYKVRLGVPYWLLNHKGEVEQVNYITNENTTFSKLNEYFSRKQILTIKKK